MFFYLVSTLVFLAIGMLLEVIFREHLFRHLKARIMWALVFLCFGLLWDIYGLYYGHWVFTGKSILGLHYGIIPVEDFLWFMVIPYFCLTVYKTAHVLLDKRKRA